MLRLFLLLPLALLAPAMAAAANFDGTWVGVLRTESGNTCDSSYGIKAEIREGRISGKLTSPVYSGTLTGTITEEGALRDVTAGGDIDFRLAGRGTSGEIAGTWSAEPRDGSPCRGGFVLFRDAAPARLPTAPATVEPAPRPEAEPKVEPAPRPEAAIAAEPEAPTAPAGRAEAFPAGIYIQLASLKSRERAREAWAGLQRDLPDLLGGQDLSLQSADLGDRGVYFRVRVGPLPNLATAEDLCWQIKAEKRDCVVVRRR